MAPLSFHIPYANEARAKTSEIIHSNNEHNPELQMVAKKIETKIAEGEYSILFDNLHDNTINTLKGRGYAVSTSFDQVDHEVFTHVSWEPLSVRVSKWFGW